MKRLFSIINPAFNDEAKFDELSKYIDSIFH